MDKFAIVGAGDDGGRMRFRVECVGKTVKATGGDCEVFERLQRFAISLRIEKPDTIPKYSDRVAQSLVSRHRLDSNTAKEPHIEQAAQVVAYRREPIRAHLRREIWE